MTSNVLPLYFAPSQASSSRNSNVDDTLEGYKIKYAFPYKIFSTIQQSNFSSTWYYKFLVSFRNARYYLPEFENQAGCYYNCIFQQLVYKCLPKYISFQLRHSANARHCNATFGWLVWPVWQFVKSNKRACKCGHIRMKSFQAFLFIQVKFWYCENATKFEKKSPTIYSVGDVKTNWNIFSNFCGISEVQFIQVKFRYCGNARKLGKTPTLF